MTTYSTPSSVSIGAEISPVNAPFSSKWTFSAPILTLLPAVVFTAVSRLVNGTHAMTSILPSAFATSGLIASSSAFASGRVLFIFQLPAMIAFLFALFMIILL